MTLEPRDGSRLSRTRDRSFLPAALSGDRRARSAGGVLDRAGLWFRRLLPAARRRRGGVLAVFLSGRGLDDPPFLRDLRDDHADRGPAGGFFAVRAGRARIP